jgi:hypothetical protein
MSAAANPSNGNPAPSAGRWVSALTGWPFFALAGVIAAGSVWSRVMLSSAHAWNDIRLVRSLALADGIPLYPGRTDGALFDVVYGPVSLPFYLPAAWLPEPKWALAAGCFTSFLIAFGAVAWLLWSPRMNGGAAPRLRLMAIGIACFHLLYTVAEFGVWSIHVDAPALAICGFAVYFALAHGNRDGWSRCLAASAVLAGLAPWTKQTTASLTIVLFLYFLLSGYRRSAVWFGGSAISTATVAGAAFTARWGFDGMFLSMFEMPSRHAIEWERLSEAGRHVRDLLDIAGVCSLAILVWHAARDSKQSGGAARWQLWQPWVLYAAAAIGLAPLASVAWLKQGGNVNNLAYIDYFLMLAGLLAMLNVCSGSYARTRPSMLTGIQLALAALLAMQLLRSVPDVLRIPNDFQVFSNKNPSQIAFEYDREHPGTVYFPWHPYAVYRAEQKLYHAGYPVLDRERAGMPLSDGHLLRYLPPGMKYIAFLSDTGRGILQRFPEFRCSVALAGLERFEVLSRCEEQAEPPAPVE